MLQLQEDSGYGKNTHRCLITDSIHISLDTSDGHPDIHIAMALTGNEPHSHSEYGMLV